MNKTTQGQEKDPETGKEAFQLRLWDGLIGRWLSPDPYGQYASPYLGMGNNPISNVDPDGGMACPNPPCQTTISSVVAEGFTPLSGELAGLGDRSLFPNTTGTQLLSEVILFGQTREFKAPDPMGFNINTWIFGTSRIEVFNGSEFIPTEDFSQVKTQKIMAPLIVGGPKPTSFLKPNVSAGNVIFNSSSKEALKRLGVLDHFVKIENGAARINIGFLRNFRAGDLQKVEQTLLANGATEVRVASGLSVHPTIVKALSKRSSAGEGFAGFEIVSGWRAWITGNRFVLKKSL